MWEKGAEVKDKIKIAIFGLSLNIQDEIKRHIEVIFQDQAPIDWVAINDSQIDILLLNDLFFNSKVVQEHIQKRNVSYLRLLMSETQSGLIEGDTLYLPFVPSETINAWFNDRYLDVPLRNKKINRDIIHYEQQDINKIVDQLLNEQNDNLQIFDQHGILGLLNTKTEQVWCDPKRKIKGTHSSLNFVYATMQMTQDISHIQGIDLYHWLWNVFWYSPDLILKINPHSSYKLIHWCQPDDSSNHKSIIKLSACFEKGASLMQVHQKTGIDIDFIQRFISAGMLSKTMKEIDPHEAALTVVTEVPIESTVNTLMNKFKTFGRFPNWAFKS